MEVSHPFLPAASAVCGIHPHALVCPYFHQRGCARGGHPGFDCQGCCGAFSSSISRLLQLPACGLEDLGVVATCHRPVSPQSLRERITLPQGDHPVCSSVCLTGGLDGLHRPSGGISLGSCSSGISSLPALCGSWPHLPVQSAVLRSVHGPAGLHSGYGSCVRYTSFLGYPYASLPGRLARPGLLTGGSPPGSRSCLVPLLRVGDRSQPGEIQLLSVSGGPVSRRDHRRADFYGFSIARSHLQAAVNRRRISALRRTSCQLVAVAVGDVVLSVPSGSRGPPADEVAPDLPSPLLGSVGSSARVAWSPDCLQDLRWWLRGVSLRHVSPDLDQKLGGSLGRQGCFRPLGPVGDSSSSQFQGIAGSVSRSPPLPVLSVLDHGGGVLRQRHRSRLSAQGGRHQVSCSQHHCAGDLPLGGISSDSAGSPVHSGDPQCSCGLSLPSSSAPQLRVVSQLGRVSFFVALVAGDDRPICHLRQSPLLHLFLALPRPSFGGDGRAPPVLGRSPGVRFSTVVHSSSGVGEASGVQPDPPHPSRPLLASASVVRGPPPVVGGSSSGSSCSTRTPLPAMVSSALPGSPQAGPSCLEIIQRFTRAAGFSSAVAAQAPLARHPSSRSNYQLKWSVYRSWCRSQGHSISRPSLSKVADFLWWLRSVRGLSVSSIKGYRSMLSSMFWFHLPALSAHPVLWDLLRSFRVSAPSYPMHPSSWDLSKVLCFLISNAFEPLCSAPLRALSKKVLFLHALATAKQVGELQALSRIVSFVGDDACLSYVPEFVAKSESLSRSIPRSFLVKSLSDFAAGLDDDLLLCPVHALRIYLNRTLSLAPSRRRLFVSPSCPRAPCLRMRFPFSCARSFMGLRRPVLRWVRSVPMTFVGSLPQWRSTVTGRSPRCLTRPPGAPVLCLPHFTCVTFSMSFKVFARWVRSWLQVRGSRSPRLFPIRSGGGGGSMSPLSPLLRGLFQLLVVVAYPSSSCSGLGVSRFCVFYSVFIVYSLYVYFLYLFYACPSLNCPVGLCFWTHDMTSDWLFSGIPPRLFQDSVA